MFSEGGGGGGGAGGGGGGGGGRGGGGGGVVFFCGGGGGGDLFYACAHTSGLDERALRMSPLSRWYCLLGSRLAVFARPSFVT